MHIEQTYIYKFWLDTLNDEVLPYFKNDIECFRLNEYTGYVEIVYKETENVTMMILTGVKLGPVLPQFVRDKIGHGIGRS